MHKVVIFGAGKIGTLIAVLLAESDEYQVTVCDIDFNGQDQKRLDKLGNKINKVSIDVQDQKAMSAFLDKDPQQALISCLPYFCNFDVVKLARQYNLHYFDLTEDTKVTACVKEVAEGAKTAFVPQCGLAPGFIGIAAHSLMRKYDKLDTVKLRVGALPINASNVLQYSLTWSTDGLINEYGNQCQGIEEGELRLLQPLEGLESIQIDGLSYEAFNTSGGLGSLAEMYKGKLNTLNYKTIRYPGHCEKMHLLMNDLKLNEDRETLKRILENAVPKTFQDVVLIYASASGWKKGQYLESNYVNKVYPQEIAGMMWSAIQVTTACGVCAVLDQVVMSGDTYQGLVLQEDFDLEVILANRFGKHYLGN